MPPGSPLLQFSHTGGGGGGRPSPDALNRGGLCKDYDFLPVSGYSQQNVQKLHIVTVVTRRGNTIDKCTLLIYSTLLNDIIADDLE